MVETVDCETHGASEIAYVCAHLVDTLKDGAPRGMHWIRDAEGEIQAFCDACWDATDEEWEWIQEQGPKILCQTCLSEAAALNNLEVIEEE